MINNISEFICDDMNYFMLNNNSTVSENYRFLSIEYEYMDVQRIVKK